MPASRPIFDDFNTAEDMIYRQTGEYTNLFRFPGGSSNTVSSFNPGIMSRLAYTMTNMGYQYFDWHVDSNDAGGTNTIAGVLSNVTSGCDGRKTSVVLQHDVKDYSVAAVEQIIIWGLRNGYTFRALDLTSPTAHHTIANVEAGLYAASGKGGQSSIILAVTDKALRDRLMKMNRHRSAAGRRALTHSYGAWRCWWCFAKKGTPYTVADGSLSMGNMMLAAHALGLGSCWINRAREAFDTEEGKEILRSLGVEETMKAWAIACGLSDGDLLWPRRGRQAVFWAE